MHKTSLFIALRYLWSHKGSHAIQIVSRVASVAVMVVSMALVIILSVYNGYKTLILESVSDVDPPLLLQRENRSVFDITDHRLQNLLNDPGVAVYAPFLYSKAMGYSGGRQAVLQLIGTDERYLHISPLLSRGTEDGYRFSKGQGALAAQVAHYLQAYDSQSDSLSIVVPRRKGLINPMFPASAFRTAYSEIQTIFQVDQEEYAYSLFLPIDELQSLLDYGANEIQAVGMRPKKNLTEKELKNRLLKELPDGFVLLDQVEQHPDLMRMVAVEKWITFLILFFVLLLSAFNISASISMLLIEKEADISTLYALGVDRKRVIRIFTLEGLLIAFLGAVIGIVVGILIVLSQSHWGWATTLSTMGPIPYPVKISLSDICAVFLSVFAIAFFVSYYPIRLILPRKIN